LIPPGFDAWFSRAVHRDPGARFADARQAFAALDPVLGGTAAGAPRGHIGDTLTESASSPPVMAIGMTVPTPETVRDHASHGPAADAAGWQQPAQRATPETVRDRSSHGPAADAAGWQRAPEVAQKTVAEDPWAALNRAAAQAAPG